MVHETMGDHDQALRDYDQAIRADPNFGWAYFSRGSEYFDKGDYGRAIEEATQAIERDSKTHTWFGSCLSG